MCTTRITTSLMINVYRRGFSLEHETRLRWIRDHSQVNWEEFVCCQVRANKTYSGAKCQFSIRNMDVLTIAQSPHKL